MYVSTKIKTDHKMTQFQGRWHRQCSFHTRPHDDPHVGVCSVVSDSETPWTVAPYAPLSVEFSRQEYWSGCHFLLQGIFPAQGLNLSIVCFLHCQQILYGLNHQGNQLLQLYIYIYIYTHTQIYLIN